MAAISLPTLPCQAELRDGSQILIRAITPQDVDAFLDGFDRLSYNSIYNRFFEYRADLSQEELDYYLQPDFDSHVALVAEGSMTDEKELVASFRYFIEPTNSREAEFACIVADHYQGRGIGSTMLRKLATIARHQGVEYLVATAFSGNSQFLGMIRSVTEDFETIPCNLTREYRIDLRSSSFL